MEDNDYMGGDDDETTGDAIENDYSLRSAQYIEKWSTAGFLTKYPGDDGDDLHELTADTQKVFNWLEDLKKPAFVGTNSRFRDIFSRLKEMIEQSNADPEARIAELEKKKWAIEEEINQIRLGKKPHVFSDTDIKERFYDINKSSRELLADFSMVEQNFQQIRKELQRKYAESEGVKGSLLIYAFDALDEINSRDQGRSFRSFWEFLMDEKRQAEFSDLTNTLYNLLSERGIDYQNDRFLKNLKRYLHASGQKVMEANKQLSEKISRVLSERNILERKRAMELIAAIRKDAFLLMESNMREEDFMVIEDQPFINLVDRWIPGNEKESRGEPVFPEGEGGELSGDVNFSALFDQFTIDRKKLLARIETMLQDRSQISLKELLAEFEPENGLGEVIGYFSIACANDLHIILDTNDPIILKNRQLNIPMVLFTKPV